MAHPINDALHYTRVLFDLSMAVDALEKKTDSKQIETRKLEERVFEKFGNAINGLLDDLYFAKTAISGNQIPVEAGFLVHVETKMHNLNSKYALYKGAADVAVVPAPLFQNHIPQISVVPVNIPQTPQGAPVVPQLIVPVVELQNAVPPAPQPIISKTLSRLSFFLRNNNEQQAFEEFKNLPENVKKAVFGALWVVRGRPGEGHPMHHPNFGETSFFNWESRCASTLQQKACAVELVKTEQSIQEVITLLKADRFEEAKGIFLKLPSQIKGAIYGEHWVVCEKPMGKHPMAHDNFGEVSFLNTEARCQVPCAKKAETLEVYLPKFVKNSNVAQELTVSEIQMWKNINFIKISGSEKLAQKIASFHVFAEKAIKLFLGENTVVKIPATTAFKETAVGYILEYPFLMPFVLQLENMLAFPGEKLEE